MPDPGWGHIFIEDCFPEPTLVWRHFCRFILGWIIQLLLEFSFWKRVCFAPAKMVTNNVS